MQLLRRPAVLSKTGYSKSTHSEKIADGLFTSPVKIGVRSSAWPDFEVDAIIAAIIRGESEEQIKELVIKLVESRKTYGLDVNYLDQTVMNGL